VNASWVGPADGRRPLIALVCDVPLIAEAISSALEEIAEVRVFPGGRGDTDGLLRSLGPDGVVVDSPREAAAAVEFARERGIPLVEVSLVDQTMRVLGPDGWDDDGAQAATPEGIRNLLVGRIFGREAVRER
jgi:hypothetical protein